MKKVLFLVFAIFLVITFVSCVDEDDFNMDRLSQTTINPTFGANLLSMDFSLSDFLDLDSIADSSQGVELATIYNNDGSFDYMQFEITQDFDLSFNQRNDFNKMLPAEPMDLNLAQVYIPNIGGISGTYTIVDYTDASIPIAPLTPIEQHRRIDSLILSAGTMNIATNSALPCTMKLILSSQSIINPTNNTPLLDTITIAQGNQGSTDLDLSNYKIILAQRLGHGDTTFLDLQYKIIAEITPTTQSGNYDLDVSFSFNNCDIKLAYGKVGNAEIPIGDTIKLNYLNNSDFANFVQPNNINLESILMQVTAKTNIGLKTVLDLSSMNTLSVNDRRVSLFNPNTSILLNRSLSPGEESTSTFSLSPNTSAIEMLPNRLVYNMVCRLYDQDTTINNVFYPNFIYPTASYLHLHTKTIIPVKAIIDSLKTQEEISDFDFITDSSDESIGQYVESAVLNLKVQNGFPASLKLNILMKDNNGVVYDTLLANPVFISAANVDNNGKVQSPTNEKISIEITKEKYKSLRRAKKVDISVVMKTSTSPDGTHHFIKFEKNSKLNVKLGIKAKTSISF